LPDLPARRDITYTGRMNMKKILAMVVAAMMALSFSMVAVAADKKPVMKNASCAKKAKKGAKKSAKAKDDAAKPAKKGKKEVSGC
jgi:type IV secretory pathway VirB6-like protein